MTYHYECDGFCKPGTIYDGRPALTAEFNEQFFESTRIGGQLARARVRGRRPDYALLGVYSPAFD